MRNDELFSLALDDFKESWATQTIAAKVQSSDYDRGFGERICRLMFEKCERDLDQYRAALRDFIALSEEFLRLQFELDRTGRYLYATFEEARRAVYDNPEVMDGRYLNGLFLSEAFWVNHTRIHGYFIAQFAERTRPSGSVLEVPSGTGIFITEFMRLNPAWAATAIDLSASAVRFTRAMVRLNGGCPVAVREQDVFDLPHEPYDRIICGELLEHLEFPERLLETLRRLLATDGKIFLTTAIWAASPDHIYLFKSTREVREMLGRFFAIESDLALNVRDAQAPDQERTPINYACVLVHR